MTPHRHKPVPHAPYIVYVPVQRQRFYTCATCGIPLFVIPTPEEADEYDRVLEGQLEERLYEQALAKVRTEFGL